MDELVERLSKGDHRIEFRGSPDRTAAELKERFDDGYVRVKFMDTKGGTEVGMLVDKTASDLSGADFQAGQGVVRLQGTLKLNWVPVRFLGEVQLDTLAGTGHLEVLHVEAGAEATAAAS
jgi:hypothetical protein